MKLRRMLIATSAGSLCKWLVTYEVALEEHFTCVCSHLTNILTDEQIASLKKVFLLEVFLFGAKFTEK